MTKTPVTDSVGLNRPRHHVRRHLFRQFVVSFLVGLSVVMGLMFLSEGFRISLMITIFRPFASTGLRKLSAETVNWSPKIEELLFPQRQLGGASPSVFDISTNGANFKRAPRPKFDEFRNGKTLKIVPIRLVGNNMPPLQGIQQLRRNMEFIIENEKESESVKRRERSVNSHVETGVEWLPRVWALNRIFNSTERDQIVQLLRRQEELFVEIPLRSVLLSESSSPPLYATNQGAARNFAFTEGAALGADWILTLDGNTFLTTESRSSLSIAISDAEMANAKYLFVPMYRLMVESRGRSTTTSVKKRKKSRVLIPPFHLRGFSSKTGVSNFDNFNVNGTRLSAAMSFPEVFPAVARMEAQLFLRKDAPFIFPEDRAYGDRNKYLLMEEIQKNHSMLVHCSEADIGFDRPNMEYETELVVVKRCGYVLRLPYWSLYRNSAESAAPANRYLRRWESLTVFEDMLADSLGRSVFFEHGKLISILIFGSFLGSSLSLMMQIFSPFLIPKLKSFFGSVVGCVHVLQRRLCGCPRRFRRRIPVWSFSSLKTISRS